MTLEKVYLVVCYSRFREEAKRLVISYPDQVMAAQHAERGNEWLKGVGCHFDDSDESRRRFSEGAKPTENPWDAEWTWDSFGSGYDVEELSFFLHIDQYIETVEAKGVTVP